MRSSRVIFLFLILFSPASQASENKFLFDSANAAYARAEFEKAIKGYEQILQANTVSAEVYYNLGNAYYKTGDLGPAILNYERAMKLAPDDEDIQTNLKFANQKTEDKIDVAPQLFLSEWKNGLLELMSERAWGITCICLVCLSLLLISQYIVSTGKTIKQISFYTGSILMIISICTFFISKHKYQKENFGKEAIITAASVTVTGSPTDKGTRLFLLHEGTKVEILEQSSGWSEIKIANGNTGWLKDDQLEKI